MILKRRKMTQLSEIEYWLSEKEIQAIYSSKYWNDKNIEMKKYWWLFDKENAVKFKENLFKHGYLQQFKYLTDFAKKKGLLKGKVLDIAAGTCWTSALISREDDITYVDASDISLHRIKELAPEVFQVLNANTHKINRIIGSFYDIKREDAYYDCIIMAQAFHHAKSPDKLLNEIKRVLRPGGILIVFGEHPITLIKYIKRIFGFLYRNKKLEFSFNRLFPTNTKSGDHNYRYRDYKIIFKKYGFKLRISSSKYGFIAEL